MNIALSTDRRRQFNNVVIADPRIVDRRQEWRDRKDALESERVRQNYIAQSAFRREYERAEMLDAQEPSF